MDEDAEDAGVIYLGDDKPLTLNPEEKPQSAKSGPRLSAKQRRQMKKARQQQNVVPKEEVPPPEEQPPPSKQQQQQQPASAPLKRGQKVSVG